MGFFKGLLINYAVKKTRGFSPGQKLRGGMTVYQASLTLLSMMLVRYARDRGPIDAGRLEILERVLGHFNEHVMFTESPAEIARGVVSDMSRDHDQMGAHRFSQIYEEGAAEFGRMLPVVARKEVVAHLAMFQRVDSHTLSNQEREACVRDAHALLMSTASPEEVREVMGRAGGYVIERRTR